MLGSSKEISIRRGEFALAGERANELTAECREALIAGLRGAVESELSMRIAQSCAAEQPRATGARAHTSPGTGAARAAAARSSVETQRELRAIVAPASELSDAIPPSLFLGGVRGVA